MASEIFRKQTSTYFKEAFPKENKPKLSSCPVHPNSSVGILPLAYLGVSLVKPGRSPACRLTSHDHFPPAQPAAQSSKAQTSPASLSPAWNPTHNLQCSGHLRFLPAGPQQIPPNTDDSILREGDSWLLSSAYAPRNFLDRSSR